MTPVVSSHALTRARQHFGWPGSMQTLSALLASYRGVQEGLKMQNSTDQEWMVKIPREGFKAVFKGPVVVTVIPFSATDQLGKSYVMRSLRSYQEV